MNIKTVFHIAYYELRHIFKNPILFIIVFIAPTVYALYFSAVYCHGVLSDIPLGIVDMDNSHLSDELVTAFSNNPYFETVEVSSYKELQEDMKTNKVRAGVVIPEDFEKDVRQNRHTETLNVYDASNLIWGLNTRKNTMEVIDKFNNQYTAEYLAGAGMNEHEATRVINSVSCNIVSWYNPTNSYPTYIILGLMMMLIQQLGLMSVGLTITREKEHNTWLHFVTSGVSWSKIVAGKCLPYFSANLTNFILVIFIAVEVAGAKMEGSILLMLSLGLLYVIIITFLGFVISLFSADSLQVTRYLALLSLPIFMISGYSWPATHIPGFLNTLASIFPSTWMMTAGRMVSVKGLEAGYLGETFAVMSLMAVIVLMFSLLYPHIEKKLPA
ncbi:MAG: ABC transporter permease [Syntrophomonadaceae bacterium]